MKDKILWTTERRKLKDLKPWEGNPRQAGEKEYGDVKKSMDKFGVADALIINTDNQLIGGHLRTKILTESGEQEVDVRVPNRKLTESEMKELNLRLNKNQGRWDMDLLANFDNDMLADVGFESQELDNIFNLDSEEDDFNGEEEHDKIKESKIKVGDMYILGKHRIMCGDSTKEKDVTKLLGGRVADMVFTDPPYNMDYKSHKKGGILNDNMPEEMFVEFAMEFIARMKESIKTGGAFYICSGYNSFVPFLYALKSNGLELQDTIIWVKNMLGMGMNDYKHKHELIIKAQKKSKKKKGQPIMYGWNGGNHYFADTHSEADVWEVSKRSTNTMVHPTQKPLELVSRAIRNSSKRGEIVLDLFLGSASTLIAAEKEERVCFGLELDPKYIETAIKRFEAYTDQKAVKQDN